MTTKKKGKKSAEKDAPQGNHKIRRALLTLAVAVGLFAALPFIIKKDKLPAALQKNPAVNSYYNGTHNIVNKVDKKIDTLHEAAQAGSRGAKPAPDGTAGQKGYTEQDREKLDELITKGTAPP
jgi:hypothetical protein